MSADALLYERFLPALPPSVGRMRRELVGVLVSNDLAPSRRDDIALVLTEAAANVVTHAYVPGATGPLYTSATLNQASLTISIVDFGRGLGAPSSPGGGYGLMLLRELTDELQVTPNAPEAGTSVHASFDRVRPTPAATRIVAIEETDRTEVLREYLHALQETAALRQESQAVLEQTRRALAVSRERRALSAARRARP